MQGVADGAIAAGISRIEDGRASHSANVMRFEPNREKEILLRGIKENVLEARYLLRFDTFTRENVIIEAEDYDFEGGQFLDNPVAASESFDWQPMSYFTLRGIPEIDYHSPREPRVESVYRSADTISIQRSFDHVRPWYAELGGPEGGIYDFMVHQIEAGDFRSYTRDFPAGAYEIYLRQALLGIDRTEAVLERVDRSNGLETITPLGRFISAETGFQFINVALGNQQGETIWVPLEGETTLRLRQLSPLPEGGDIYQNYLVLTPRLNSPVVLYSAPSLDGPWSPDTSALYDLDQGLITTGQPNGSTRFFQVWSSESLSIKRVKLDGLRLFFSLEEL